MNIRGYSTNLILTFLSTISALLIFSCSDSLDRTITRSVYHWKSSFKLDESERSWLKENSINKIYVRFFDVDWNTNIDKAVPVGDVQIGKNIIDNIEIVPVIFITNRTIKTVPDSLLDELSQNIYKKIQSKLAFLDSASIKEIQIDCDWTTSTKDKYFRLLKEIKQMCAADSIILSATIRLHQVKFFEKTGIPPVDRGMLMFYNMSDVSDMKTKNSIFDSNVAEKYLINFDNYPLALDVVLPAFSWVCHFRRDKLIALINDVDKNEIESSGNFEKHGALYYRAVKAFYLKGNYIAEGDLVRIENITPQNTLRAAEMISPHIKNKDITISIYHLNGELINEYEKDGLQNIFSSFN